MVPVFLAMEVLLRNYAYPLALSMIAENFMYTLILLLAFGEQQ
jgi:hypothetical protein